MGRETDRVLREERIARGQMMGEFIMVSYDSKIDFFQASIPGISDLLVI